MCLYRIAFLVALLTAPILSVADTYPINPAIDIVHYRFELDISDEPGRQAASAAIRARFLADGVRRLRLDLSNETIERDGRGMSVSAVSHEGAALDFRHENDVLWIELPRSSAANDVFEVTIDYAGFPATGLLIKENKCGEITAFSDNWPDKAPNWLPVVDHISDKATREMLITVPEHWQVVSNGVLVEESGLGGGLRGTHWRQSVPIAPWLYVLAAADFDAPPGNAAGLWQDRRVRRRRVGQ
jgi:aminopeptidase N